MGKKFCLHYYKVILAIFKKGIMMQNNFDLIYLDFDGTITKKDTVGAFLENFADKEWIDIELDWIKGKINSKTCMQMQLDLIKNLTQKDFDNFLNSIELQDGFLKFYKTAKENNKKITILSDGFDIFIDYTLKKANLDIKFYSNHLDIKEENGFLKFKLFYPNEYKNCNLSLGNCKCAKLEKDITGYKKFIYAGDGLSDRCIASKSNLLFAKNSLKSHCLKNGIKFNEFNDFFDILNYLSKEGIIKNAGFKTKDINRS